MGSVDSSYVLESTLETLIRRAFESHESIRRPTSAAACRDRTMFGEAVLDFEILEGPLDRVDAQRSRWRPFQPCSVH